MTTLLGQSRAHAELALCDVAGPCEVDLWHSSGRRAPSRSPRGQILRLTALLLLGVFVLGLSLRQRTRHDARAEAARPIVLSEDKRAPSPQVQQADIVTTHASDMQLVQQSQDVLPQYRLAELQRALLQSPWVVPLKRRKGRLGTKGVTLTFNTGGVDHLSSAHNLSQLASFFSSERLPGANAWVLSLVAIEGCPGFKADQGIWAIHRDELRSAGGDYFREAGQKLRLGPHSVTVLNVWTPKDIFGGSTWLWHADKQLPPVSSEPAAIVPPKANTKFVFRGDAFHGVSGQNSSGTDAGAAISLILEQYKVPTALYSQSEDFKIRPFVTEYRAKRPDKRAYHLLTDKQRKAAARLLRKPAQAP